MNAARIEHLRHLHDRALDRVEDARRQLRAARADAGADFAEVERLADAVREAERDAAHIEKQILEAAESEPA